MSTKPSTKEQENALSKRREPLGFMLWLGVVGSSLLFTTIFVIYLFRMHEDNNHFIALPDMFWLSTLVILFSSITRQISLLFRNAFYITGFFSAQPLCLA
jgi:cytochrome c oxidase subunit 3